MKEEKVGDLGFDESYNIREAIDFLTEKLSLREKLIQSARQFSEKDGGQKFSITVKRFEDLLTDFLRLYQPVLDRVAGHKESLQKEILNQKLTLTGVTGMIEVARGVDVLADRVKELESEAKTIETTIKDKSKSLERIDYLLSKTRRRAPPETTQRIDYETPQSESADEGNDFFLGLDDTEKKSPSTGSRKVSTRGG